MGNILISYYLCKVQYMYVLLPSDFIQQPYTKVTIPMTMRKLKSCKKNGQEKLTIKHIPHMEFLCHLDWIGFMVVRRMNISTALWSFLDFCCIRPSQVKYRRLFQIGNFLAAEDLHWTVNHCNWRRLSFYLQKHLTVQYNTKYSDQVPKKGTRNQNSFST